MKTKLMLAGIFTCLGALTAIIGRWPNASRAPRWAKRTAFGLTIVPFLLTWALG